MVERCDEQDLRLYDWCRTQRLLDSFSLSRSGLMQGLPELLPRIDSEGKESEKKVTVAQSCLTLCDLMDYTVHGIFQARILEWVAVPFTRGSSQPRDWTQVSCITGGFFTSWVTREAQEYWSGQPIPSPVDLLDPEIEPGSPALQVDSLLTELPGKSPRRQNLKERCMRSADYGRRVPMSTSRLEGRSKLNIHYSPSFHTTEL